MAWFNDLFNNLFSGGGKSSGSKPSPRPASRANASAFDLPQKPGLDNSAALREEEERRRREEEARKKADEARKQKEVAERAKKEAEFAERQVAAKRPISPLVVDPTAPLKLQKPGAQPTQPLPATIPFKPGVVPGVELKKPAPKPVNPVNEIGKFLAKPVARLANTGYAGIQGVTGLTQAGVTAAMGDKAEAARIGTATRQEMDKALKKGSGLFGVGGDFKSTKEATNLTPEEFAKKFVAAGLETAGTVAPIGRGVSVAKNVAGKTIKPALVKLSAQGAALGGLGSAGGQYADNGKIDPIETGLGAASGGVLAPAAFGGAKLVAKTGLSTALKKAVSKGEDAQPLPSSGKIEAIDVEKREVAPGVKTKTPEPETISVGQAGEPAPPNPGEVTVATPQGASPTQSSPDQLNPEQKAITDEILSLEQKQMGSDNYLDPRTIAREGKIDELKAQLKGMSQTDQAIPDPANPIALAKPDTPAVPDETIMADFGKPENGSLKKATVDPAATPAVKPTPTTMAQDAAKGELRATPEIDAQGNPVIRSDKAEAQALAESGVAPQREASVVATQDGAMDKAAEQAAKAEVNIDANAPLARERVVTKNISDPDVADDLRQNAPKKEKVGLEDAENKAKGRLSQETDESLYGREFKVEDPEGFFYALNAIRRLDGDTSKGAQEAVKNALDSMTEYSAKSGRGLRTTQVLFDDMPTTMKVDYLEKKLSKAGVDLQDSERERLLGSITIADASAAGVRSKQADMDKLLNDLSIGKNVPEGKIKKLADELDNARLQKELRAGEALDIYKSYQDKPKAGARVGEAGRALMLSAPSGRGFDVASTAATSLSDLATRGVSSAIGKVVNKIKGAGTVVDTGPKASKLFKGTKGGFGDLGRAVKDKDRVESFMGAERRATRGDISGRSLLSKVIRPMVEAPTHITRGLEAERLYSLGKQEGQKLGLKGKQLDDYATGRAASPNEKQLAIARDAHLRANMLHENVVSRKLNEFARKLDDNGKASWFTPLVRNQIAPFTSWLGGNFHRAFTDKNVLWNAGSAIKNFKRGDLQAGIDDVSRLAVNTGEAYVLGYMLTEADIITDTDANGDTYGGLYLHLGDRYVPVSILGTAAVPLILGNGVHKGMTASKDGDLLTGGLTALANTVVNSGKNTGVAGVFGGENNLQKTVAGLLSSEGGDNVDQFSDFGLKYAGNVGRQFLPGLFSDVNAGLDYNDNLNPTNEDANTDVFEKDPETGKDTKRKDVFQTELNKFKDKIPFVSQDLPRQEGKAAKDILDRFTKGTHETGEMKKARLEEKAKTDTEEARKEDDIPDKPEAIKARFEDGDYDRAIKGYKQQLSDIKNDEDVPKSTKENLKKKIELTALMRDKNYDPEMVKEYEKVSLSEWREMGDPAHENYDPERYQLMYDFDNDMKGIKQSRKGDGDENKYYAKVAKGGGKGSRGGSRGGSGGSAPSFNPDIATNSISFPSSGLKELAAVFGLPPSALPALEKAKNYDTSRLRKVKVTKGVR